MSKAVICPSTDIRRSKHFILMNNIIKQDENITSDEDEPMDVDTTSQRLQVINMLNNFYALEGELSA